MIDGKTLFYWFQDGQPQAWRRWEWTILTEDGQNVWNTFAERIKAEMGQPLVVDDAGFTEEDVKEFFRPGAVIVIDPLLKAMESKEPYKPGDVIPLGALPPGTIVQVEELSKAIFKDAIENTLIASTEPDIVYSLRHYKAVKFDPKSYGVVTIGTADDELGFDPKYSERILEQAIKEGKMPGQTKVAKATTNDEYSTHHKSCALRHDGITCTCP